MTISDAEIVLQRRAARLVSQEVNACMSSLVATLASGGIAETRDAALSGLIAQATELTFSTLDYESAANEHGWTCTPEGWWWREPSDEEREDGSADFYFLGSGPFIRAESAEAACELDDIGPDEREVYEHWAISQWLAEKLIAKGERVDTDFAGLNVWARTTTGQAISIDGVIEAIVRETGYAGGGE